MKTLNHKLKSLKGFTLVELLVVISILAILWTIAFLSFTNYSSSARDSTRISDINSISKWLSLQFATSGKYPQPDSKIDITASGTTIWYQWYAWTNTLSLIKLSNWWKDPIDNSYYTYTTNLQQNKYELLWFLEDWTNINLSFNSIVNALDYSKRFILTKWNLLWILLNSWTLEPAQSLTATPIDILNTTTNYIAQFDNKNNISWTGIILYQLQSTMKIWASKFPWCDKYDISIWNQTWAGCNSTIWSWMIYNSWSNNCRNYAWAYITWSTACYWDTTKEKDYNVTYWVDNIWWKLYLWNDAPSACTSWYHVPSEQDFLNLEIALTCTDSSTDLTWRCSWLWWSWSTSKNPSNNIIKALNLPLAGFRISGTFYNRGNNAGLRSSTEYDATYARGRAFPWNNDWVNRNYWSKFTHAFPVRCVKD